MKFWSYNWGDFQGAGIGASVHGSLMNSDVKSHIKGIQTGAETRNTSSLRAVSVGETSQMSWDRQEGKSRKAHKLCLKLWKKVKWEACHRKPKAVTEDSIRWQRESRVAQTLLFNSFSSKEHVFINTERHKWYQQLNILQCFLCARHSSKCVTCITNSCNPRTDGTSAIVITILKVSGLGQRADVICSGWYSY